MVPIGMLLRGLLRVPDQARPHHNPRRRGKEDGEQDPEISVFKIADQNGGRVNRVYAETGKHGAKRQNHADHDKNLGLERRCRC